MKNKKLLSYALLTALLSSPAAFADSNVDVSAPATSNDVLNDITADLSKKLAEELSKEDIAASTQDYQVEDFERAQPRRSALFLHILNSIVKDSTLAKTDESKQQTTKLL